MKKRIFCGLVCAVSLFGCATGSTVPAIGSQPWYDVRIQEINRAFAAGELTKQQQLSLINETDNLRMLYQRDIDRRMDRNLYRNSVIYNRPVYDCNNGVCTPVYP